MGRNKTIFEDDFQHQIDPTFKILKMVEDIEKYTQDPLNIHQSDTIFIGWKRPREGWIKINCDGAYKNHLDLAGCGELFHNLDVWRCSAWSMSGDILLWISQYGHTIVWYLGNLVYHFLRAKLSKLAPIIVYEE